MMKKGKLGSRKKDWKVEWMWIYNNLYTGICGYIQVYTGIYRYIRIYADIYII